MKIVSVGFFCLTLPLANAALISSFIFSINVVDVSRTRSTGRDFMYLFVAHLPMFTCSPARELWAK